MDPADDLTFEDLLSAARCGHAMQRRRHRLDLVGLMLALRNRARIAGRYRARCGEPHPRYGDGSVSSVSAMLARRVDAPDGDVARLRDLLPALGAACLAWRNR